jgi:hypothetical protein
MSCPTHSKFVILIFAGIVSLCRSTDLHAADYASVLIDNVPHVRQKPDFCGEACTEMYLQKLGYEVDQDFVFDQSGLDPLLARGCFTRELKQSLEQIGFDVGAVWYSISASKPEPGLQAMFAKLHADLLQGTPAIVCTHFDHSPQTTEHFRLVIGYDHKTDEIIYHDPALDDGAALRMKRTELLDLWTLKYADDRWTVIYLPLRHEKLNVSPPASRFTAADFAQHLMKLKKKLPSDDFHVVIQNPFVVIGDEAAELVQRRSQQTVQWAVDRIKKTYFAQDPDEIIDIWLFKDKSSYEKHCEQLFGSKPSTPYGYYSPSNRALVMNISTGGGTLVHEIVHPFMAANFAACPSWFNEGLASLYEQSSSDRAGNIVGLTNWRLRGLQLAIQDDRVPSFETLCSTTTHEFYKEDPGTNYAQARYLCYYLQQRGLLAKYYHQFVENAASDPGGYQTLQAVLEETDMDQFKRDWEAYVLKLSFGQ